MNTGQSQRSEKPASCLIRLSVIDRGRAVPLVWQVIEHGSAAVSFETYKDL